MFNTVITTLTTLVAITALTGCSGNVVPAVEAQGSSAPPIACLSPTSVNVNTLTSGGPASTGLIAPQAGCTLMIDGFQASLRGQSMRHVWIVEAPAGSACTQYNGIISEFPLDGISQYVASFATPIVVGAPQGPAVCAYMDGYTSGEEQSITLQYHEQ